jgi:transposase-like protein
VHLRFPAEHWKRIRHSNFIERTFGETRRRIKVIGRLPGESSCLSLTPLLGRHLRSPGMSRARMCRARYLRFSPTERLTIEMSCWMRSWQDWLK